MPNVFIHHAVFGSASHKSCHHSRIFADKVFSLKNSTTERNENGIEIILTIPVAIYKEQISVFTKSKRRLSPQLDRVVKYVQKLFKLGRR